MYIARAAEMQMIDRQAIDNYSIPGIVLMENAGRGTVASMVEEFGPLNDRTIPILVGPGNNGGDGLVIARHVHQMGGHPFILYGIDLQRLQGDAGMNRQIVAHLELDALILDSEFSPAQVEQELLIRHARYPVACMVDALFGTGLSRDIRGHFAAIIEYINKLRQTRSWPIVSVDIPSGIHADTGMTLGTALTADLTVTYGLAKPAHYLHGGRHVGQLRIVDISIPAEVPRRVGLKGQALTESNLPRPVQREPDAHKGKNGHLLVLAGSEGKTGAAILCCQAALRSGCGLVSAAVPNGLNTIFETSLIETMTLPLPESTIQLAMDDLDFILAAAIGKQAIVIGPGIGTDETTQELVLFLYRELDLPMVVDADGLNILALHPGALAQAGGPRLLTPHPGEMARLLKTKNSAVQADRLGAALKLVADMQADVVVALKGAGTVIADSQGNWAINTTGNPGMASAGMGDVLAGLCGSLLAQGMTPWQSACLGVYTHGLSADILATERTYGFTAMEVANMLPDALGQIQAE